MALTLSLNTQKGGGAVAFFFPEKEEMTFCFEVCLGIKPSERVTDLCAVPVIQAVMDFNSALPPNQ